MSIKKDIIEIIREKGIISGAEIARIIGVSRQAVNKHLIELIKSGVVQKTGATRNAKYSISNNDHKKQLKIEKHLRLDKISEDIVFKQLALSLNLKKNISKNTFEIFHYAFTEILNNAIEHSKSDRCKVIIEMDDFNLSFLIRDYGIGIFFSIASRFDLQDESESIIELCKGKRTTFKEKHSGEGVFFTSKIGDTLRIRSHKLLLVFDNQINDIFFGNRRFINGTEVFFTIKKHSKRKLDNLFLNYAPEEFDYKFQRTRVSVKLLNKEYISRSEAKRLLAGLDKFNEIILDFSGVKSIGQGFADEIFRVFKDEHPHISIITINLSDSLQKIIKHVSVEQS